MCSVFVKPQHTSRFCVHVSVLCVRARIYSRINVRTECCTERCTLLTFDHICVLTGLSCGIGWTLFLAAHPDVRVGMVRQECTAPPKTKAEAAMEVRSLPSPLPSPPLCWCFLCRSVLLRFEQSRAMPANTHLIGHVQHHVRIVLVGWKQLSTVNGFEMVGV